MTLNPTPHGQAAHLTGLFWALIESFLVKLNDPRDRYTLSEFHGDIHNLIEEHCIFDDAPVLHQVHMHMMDSIECELEWPDGGGDYNLIFDNPNSAPMDS